MPGATRVTPGPRSPSGSDIAVHFRTATPGYSCLAGVGMIPRSAAGSRRIRFWPTCLLPAGTREPRRSTSPTSICTWRAIRSTLPTRAGSDHLWTGSRRPSWAKFLKRGCEVKELTGHLGNRSYRNLRKSQRNRPMRMRTNPAIRPTSSSQERVKGRVRPAANEGTVALQSKRPPEAAGDIVGLIGGALILAWEGAKWTVAALAAPETGGASLAGAAALP